MCLKYLAHFFDPVLHITSLTQDACIWIKFELQTFQKYQDVAKELLSIKLTTSITTEATESTCA